jgi:hypothetical protein
MPAVPFADLSGKRNSWAGVAVAFTFFSHRRHIGITSSPRDVDTLAPTTAPPAVAIRQQLEEESDVQL